MYRDKRYMALSILAAVLFSIFFLNRHPFSNQSYQEHHKKTEEGNSPTARTATAFPGFPVDVNSAAMEDLTLLPGIGVKTAQRIIAKRIEAGGFSSIEEFAAAAHLGKNRIEKIRPLISLDGGRG
ncbi:MAG: helix-hairpin-helix domain-containing protein [Deltaproteobacteria bacterium]|nr:helix-hairpin-helix domain-containing protein [Deltaproteobacteria bacterium]